MEQKSQNQPQTFKSNLPTTPNTRPGVESAQSFGDKVGTAAQAVREQVEERGGEFIDNAKHKVTEVYEQANKSLTEQYEKAVDFGRENPGKTTLIAFGVGVGVGLLLVNSFSTSRSRRRGFVDPAVSALSTFAREIFR